MAITLRDMKGRLESLKEDLQQQNFGDAYQRTCNLIRVLEESGIIIHAVATVEDKGVTMDDSQEN